MAGVFYCSPTNSTHFTTCCEVAICDDQGKCPRCHTAVYPEDDPDNLKHTPHERRVARHNMSFGKARRGWYHR